MPKHITITAEYFRQYRQKLGFSNQADVKNFFGAKDIIDQNYFVWKITEKPIKYKDMKFD